MWQKQGYGIVMSRHGVQVASVSLFAGFTLVVSQGLHWSWHCMQGKCATMLTPLTLSAAQTISRLYPVCNRVRGPATHFPLLGYQLLWYRDQQTGHTLLLTNLSSVDRIVHSQDPQHFGSFPI